MLLPSFDDLFENTSLSFWLRDFLNSVLSIRSSPLRSISLKISRRFVKPSILARTFFSNFGINFIASSNDLLFYCKFNIFLDFIYTFNQNEFKKKYLPFSVFIRINIRKNIFGKIFRYGYSVYGNY